MQQPAEISFHCFLSFPDGWYGSIVEMFAMKQADDLSSQQEQPNWPGKH